MRTVNVQRCVSRGSLHVATGALMLVAAAGPAAAQQPGNKPTSGVTPEIQWNRDLLRSGRVEEVAASMAQSNKAVQEAAGTSVIDRMRYALPSVEQLSSSLKYGNFITVSAQGSEVITLIREVPVRKGKDRNDVLAKLLNFSRQGVPEAQTFSGFVYEYGLFGARRDLKLARWHYEAAAAQRYQPAIFNLANMAYLGKGQPPDPERARELIHRAVEIGAEPSSRVCGLASFIEYRRGDRDAAIRLGKSCYSGLANIPNAAYDNQMPLVRRIKLLRDSIGTGAPDGYRWLEQITQQAGPDNQQLYCKYRIINRLRSMPASADVKALARTCYENSVHDPAGVGAESTIRGITTFVISETQALDQLRRADRFHHVWSVPYLPFAQVDVDLYEPVMKETK